MITRDGVEAVKDSDSNASDSDGSLEDISGFFWKPKETSPDDPSAPTSARRSSRLTAASSRKIAKKPRFEPIRAPPPPSTKYKFSLATLKAQQERDDATTASIARLKAEAEELERQEMLATNQHIDEKAIASVVEDEKDETKGQRLLEAMKRTNVLQVDQKWEFFDANVNVKPARKFPKTQLSSCGIHALLRGKYLLVFPECLR